MYNERENNSIMITRVRLQRFKKFKDNEIIKLHCPANNEVKYNIQPIMKLKTIGESSW